MFSFKKQPFSTQKSAFTLIELMVVMGLIMIVMTLGIPRLVQHNETPLGGSISAVMDACASARSKAILSGKPMKMIVDASNYSVTVGEGRAEVTFPPNGTSDEFTIGMIHVTGDNVQRFVQLDSVTGLAYLKTEDEIQNP